VVCWGRGAVVDGMGVGSGMHCEVEAFWGGSLWDIVGGSCVDTGLAGELEKKASRITRVRYIILMLALWYMMMCNGMELQKHRLVKKLR